MLSGDLFNLAAAVRNLQKAPRRKRKIAQRLLGIIADNIDTCADQARALEAMTAPGSAQPDNVLHLDFSQKRKG